MVDDARFLYRVVDFLQCDNFMFYKVKRDMEMPSSIRN